jgi:hypothetical protein
LTGIIANGTSGFLQHFYHIERRIGKQLINKTGYE